MSLKNTVQVFKVSLSVTGVISSRQQQNSLWYEVLCYRLTASTFGIILQRKPDTPPDYLVLRILQPKQFTSPAVE